MVSSSNIVNRHIQFHDRDKLILVDDLIASGNPETDSRTPFSHNCRLNEEDVYFTNAYEPALKTIEENPNIILAVLDIRFPRRSEDLDDFNPEDPTQGWGSTLLKELRKRYTKEELPIIVITAYDSEELSDPNVLEMINGYYKKPLNTDAIAKKIQEIVDTRWSKNFDYGSLDANSSFLVKEATVKIKNLFRRTLEDTIRIGQNLIEVKKILGHGNFLDWVKKEFDWSDRTAEKFMQVAENFKIEEVADLKVSHSALVTLSAYSTPEKAKEEALERAKGGETITTYKAEEIRKKYLAEQEKRRKENKQKKLSLEADNKKNISTEQTSEKPVQRELVSPKIEPLDLEKKKIAVSSEPVEKEKRTSYDIINVQHNIVKNSYWQLGEHYLYCGESANPQFEELLPKKVTLTFSFASETNKPFIPKIDRERGLDFYSQIEDIELELENIKQILQKHIMDYSDAGNTIVFLRILHPEILLLADKFCCICHVAEPDLDICEQLLDMWKKRKRVVKRIG